ncbi:MAG: N-6 DNA methylase [Desulfotignum sp.]|nr:type I restriction-modification system subunit M [Desulfobacteraceae bacterium]
MTQLEHMDAIEKRLWSAADTLRANSSYASNEYFLPVMGLIFLRHAFSRFLDVGKDIEASLPRRGGKARALTKADFSRKSAIFLKPKAQFDHLVALTDRDDRARAIIGAMESIESDYESLSGVLPKSEYQELDNQVLGQLLRTLNPDELKQVSGDVFGRIYEYFLTQFADQNAHDGGEFFTPVSLVSLIANVLEPVKGIVLDPANGSGGMFVQSARFVEGRHENPVEKLTFYGLEKNATTIRLAKMNLAVHGLEGDIRKAITYYEDPHELTGKADFVMANPPFNVDDIDAEKVKTDPRLPFGLPGVNKKGRVSNGNYIWISYFYSYLNGRGRAGFVMSSQASSAGRDEAILRRKLVETGDVDIMIAIRSNFFYTRTVPCELWFFNRRKPAALHDSVLMIDARNIFRKVTRKIYDFSPEQELNILAIVRLYYGQTDAYLDLVARYCRSCLEEAEACFTGHSENGGTVTPLPGFLTSLARLRQALAPFLETLSSDGPQAESFGELDRTVQALETDVHSFQKILSGQKAVWLQPPAGNGNLKKAVEQLTRLSDTGRSLVKQIDLVFKLACRLINICETDGNARESDAWSGRDITRARKDADIARQAAVQPLKQVRYFWKQALWLTRRFPRARFCDVPGLAKKVSRAEIAANDWSLTPGRYVGVAPEEPDENFDFEETLREIHVELEDLNGEAVKLAAAIKKNFAELGI